MFNCFVVTVVSVKLVALWLSTPLHIRSQSAPLWSNRWMSSPNRVQQVSALCKTPDLYCTVLYCCWFGWSLPSSYFTVQLFRNEFCHWLGNASDPSKPRHPRARWWCWALGWGGPSLPFAVQDSPPVVRPRLESSLGGAGGQVLVVTGGEQDVLPCWFGLHAWSGDKH